MQNLFPSPPPPPSSSASYPLFTPHVTLSTQVSHSFSSPSLPYPSLSPEIFLPSSFSICTPCHFSSTPAYESNSFAELQGVGERGLPYKSNEVLVVSLMVQTYRVFRTENQYFFAFKCIAYGFAQRNIRIKYQTPDTVCWSVSNKARATS